MAYPKGRASFYFFLFILVLCLGLTASCAATKSTLPIDDRFLEYVPAQHLVFIGFDGWGGTYVPRANMPVVKRMMAGGASSLDFFCIMPSNSWPNWAALFTSNPPGPGYSTQATSIFSVIKNSMPEANSVFFYEWHELQNICPEDITEKKTILSDIESAGLVAGYIIENKPVFTAVVFNEPDSVGHNKRWGSAAYYDKLTELDSFIAVLEQAVKDAGIYDNTVFVLSSDHGGSLWGHGFNTRRQRRIPLIIFGSNIKEGYVIPAPGRIYDIAPTMAAILGLEVPVEWTGQIISGVFR